MCNFTSKTINMISKQSPQSSFKEIIIKDSTPILKLDTNLHNHSFQISITSKKIARFFFSIILILLFGSLFGILLKYYWNINSAVFAIIYRFFDFNSEANIPTFFSSALLLFASLILFFIKTAVANKNKYWYFLSALFLFLCVDEAAQIHENFDKLKSRIPVLTESILSHVWVLPYIILVVLLGVFLKNFLFSLPSKTRNLMILSGIVYVCGAIGLEIIEGQLYVSSNHGSSTLVLDLLYCIEEVCEMSGTTIFIYALLDYIAPKNSPISIRAN